jgi:ATP-dependent Clp protease adaptor protein ClpS
MRMGGASRCSGRAPFFVLHRPGCARALTEGRPGLQSFAMSQHEDPDRRSEGQIVVQERSRVKRPPMYAVVLLNDDFTPMEFVVWILQTLFFKARDEATRVMLEVHHNGKGIAGVYTHDVARTKAVQVEQIAKKHEHPLACLIEACES